MESNEAGHDTTLADHGQAATGFPTAPGEDLEHERIIAAAGAALFGSPELRIGHHRLVRQLGSGGMGEVFLAHDEILDRRVAIKLLRSELIRAASSDLLQREARVLARLSHPNIVQVHEFGQHGERAYLVMEYVEGRTLSDWLAHERPSWRAIVPVFTEAGAGLAAAHAVGLTHRDFKPDNVLVGVDGRTRVVDFGLALVDAELSAAARAGTPRYMAPEQLAGARADARSDQFSFCVALAEALWGVALRSPEHRPPTSSVPNWVWRAIRRGLRAEPERRWPDLGSLLRALDPRPRRRRRAFVLLGLGALGIVAVLQTGSEADPCADVARELDASFGSAHTQQLLDNAATLGDPERREATLLVAGLEQWADAWRTVRVRTCRANASELVLAQRELCLDGQRRRVAAFVERATARPEQLLVYARELTHALPSPSSCEDDEALRLGIAAPDPAIAAEVEALRELIHRAEAARVLGEAELSLPELEQAIAIAEQLDYLPVLAELEYELGSAELLAGSRERGLAWLERAGRDAYLAHDERRAASLWLELSWNAAARGELEAGHHWYERAFDAWSRVGIDAGVQARLDYAVGTLALAGERLDEAERSLTTALADAEPGMEPFVLERLAEVAELREQPEQALALRERARDAAAEHFGPEHPRTAQQRHGLGLALWTADRPADARRELELAAASWQLAHTRPHEDLAEAHQVLAALALGDGQLVAALVHAEQALSILAALLPEQDVALGDAWTTLGTVRHARGELELAVQAFATASAIYDAAADPGARQAASNLGAGLLALGRIDEARVMFERVVVDGALDDPDRVVAALGLAEIELRSGRPKLAKAWLEQVVPADDVDRLEHALLLGLAHIRLGDEFNRGALVFAVASTGERGLELIEQHVANLAIDPTELVRLGLR
jgi:tRNA A-37 threonylcarbamoyl transferase component Bud32/tetratricopeptide (TPR) repeat protein